MTRRDFHNWIPDRIEITERKPECEDVSVEDQEFILSCQEAVKTDESMLLKYSVIKQYLSINIVANNQGGEHRVAELIKACPWKQNPQTTFIWPIVIVL